MQRLIKILQSYFLQSWTLSRPFYINHEIRCLPASYLFRLVINVQKKGTSLQYKIITHNYIHNSSLWQIPSFLFLLSFAFLLASFDFSYLAPSSFRLRAKGELPWGFKPCLFPQFGKLFLPQPGAARAPSIKSTWARRRPTPTCTASVAGPITLFFHYFAAALR